MLGQPIAAFALAHAGLRQLATEFGGPRPAAVRPGEIVHHRAEARAAEAPRDGDARAMRP